MEVSTVVLSPPHDMITDILKRCCLLQTLDICKTVSKEWNQIIYDPSFMSQYYNREDNVYGYLIQNVCRCQHYHKFISVNQSDNKFAFSPKSSNIMPCITFDDVQIKSSSLQEILCCLTRSCGRPQFYVCKPTTSQWQQLPNPAEFLYSDYKEVVGMAVLGSNPLRYVIIRNSTTYNCSSRQDCNKCEIFDSMTWEWKELADLLLPDGCFIISKAGVFASGVISWITSNKTVIAFSTDGESRYTYGLPAESILHNDKDKDSSFYYHDIIEYQGKLGLICQTYDNKYVELWILENYRSGGWIKIKSIDFESVVVNEERHARPVQFYNSDVTLVKGVYEVMFCKLREEDGETGTVTATGTYNKVNTGYPTHPETFPFRSDFIPVNLKEFRAAEIIN